MEIKKLDYKQLNIDIKFDKSTKDYEPKSVFFSQDRVIKAFEVGLSIKHESYNIYVSGEEGLGRTLFTKQKLEEFSKNLPVPEDIIYYHNFEDIYKPKVLLVKAGLGKKLEVMINETLEKLKKEIYKVFEGKDYEEEKVKIIKNAEEKKEQILKSLKKDALKYNLGVLITSYDISLVPIINGSYVTNLDSLTEKQYQEYKESLDKFEDKFLSYLQEMREIDYKLDESLYELKEKISKHKLDSIYFKLENSFKEYPEIIDFLNYHKENVLKNIDKFIEINFADRNSLFYITLEKQINLFKINLFVDNSKLEHAPVVFEKNPSFKNFFGSVNFEVEMGILYADHRNITAGSFHRARGGFLVLYVKDVLKDYLLWESIKKSLKNKEIFINGFDVYGFYSYVGINPQPVPGEVKLILIGDEFTYNLLSSFDEDFQKLFKVKAEFNDRCNIDEQVIKDFPLLVKNIILYENIKDVSPEGLTELFKYLIVLSEDRKKISLNFSHITDILRESDIKADEIITDKDIKNTIREKIYRENLLEEKIIELIKEGKIIVDIDKKVIGQTNGLSVYSVGNYQFGKPSRISASAYIGEKGIINIEREVELSGPFHDKGVLILSGYLGRKYGKDIPLSLTCSITFEQSYGEVEGDSASLAELLAVLSEISEIPLKQYIAVTGSVDQHGNVQPVGGIKEKVEGFFKVCKIIGLDGKQGVVVPLRNKDNVILDDEVLNAIKDGLFNIYLVENVDEALYILSDIDPLNFHKEVKLKLEEFYKNATKLFKK